MPNGSRTRRWRERRGKGLGWKKGRGSAPRLLRAAPPAPAPSFVTYKYWNANGWWGDQGETSECVIYSWLHVIHDGPVTPKHISRTVATKPLFDPTMLYQEAQGYDGTPITEVDSGLTCDAGAKALRAHGAIGEYRWAETLLEIENYLLTTGPMTIGANWYEPMFDPNPDGTVEVNGSIAGGHQWVLDGVNKIHRIVRCKQSWGRSWGLNGFFYLTYDQLDFLLSDGAEVCVFRELPTTY